MTSTLRLRLGLHDTHYSGGLIPAATMLRLFGDCASEIGLRLDGVDGYLAAYESASFLKPLYAGDYIEINASLVDRGERSRRIEVTAVRVLESRELPGGLSTATIHQPGELVAGARLVAVRPRNVG